MALSDSSQKNMATSPDTIPPTQPTEDVAPPVGITPPEVLARDAAAGRRGSAWRLLYWIIENDPRAVVAFASLDDDRLARHLLEFIAMGSTWAGKPFVVPVPLRSAYARTRLRTLFLPGSGIDSMRAERVLIPAIHDSRPAIRENAASILGILGSRTATPALIEALQDPVPAVRLQAAKALGRVHDPAAVPALLAALQNADEQLGSQIFSSLVRLGHVAVPVLIERSTSGSAWMRWHCVRALADIRDVRALPVLVRALGDADHSIAWMGAKGLVQFGRQSVGPVLRLLMAGGVTPWLVETASYVLRNQHDPKLKPYLEPVIQSMQGVAFRIATPQAAQRALTQLTGDGVIQP